ncbi:MAG: hypothetical protein K2Y22_05455 [Candidatus Obscuribacterales bacterium]|nr:hypothetical protein [Candidatus Obscuribacterales bacterium]
MVKKRTQDDYIHKEIDACKRVLIEIVRLLSEFQDHIALVGGWVPYYIIPVGRDKHIGSLDVDVFFDSTEITNDTYETILNILKENGYYQKDNGKLFQWWKDVDMGDGSEISVEVDLLAPEYGGRSKKHEHQRIQDTKARKARGGDLIFGKFNHYEEIIIEGQLPGGAKASTKCKIAGVVPFLVMKGMALGRGKEKDSYDIEYVIRNYPGGLKALSEAFGSDKNNELVKEGLGKMRAAFETVDHVGPADIVTFENENLDEDDRAIRRQKAFQTVKTFLDALDIEKVV